MLHATHDLRIRRLSTRQENHTIMRKITKRFQIAMRVRNTRKEAISVYSRSFAPTELPSSEFVGSLKLRIAPLRTRRAWRRQRHAHAAQAGSLSHGHGGARTRSLGACSTAPGRTARAAFVTARRRALARARRRALALVRSRVTWGASKYNSKRDSKRAAAGVSRYRIQ